MRARTCARMDAGKVSRKTEKNSRKAWNCARNTEKGTEFLHGRKGTFYVSVTKNLRFRNAKRTVRMAETYVSPKENIKTMETLHDFLPEVCKKYLLIETKQQTEKGIKTFSYFSNYIRVTNFTKLFHKYNINMTL